MGGKKRFSFCISLEEKQDLRLLADIVDRSQGATLRLLIRNAARQVTEATPAEEQTKFLVHPEQYVSYASG